MVTLAVGVVAALAAWRVHDPVTSVAIVSAASLMTLPVTWYHYPAALIPVGIALAVGNPASRPRLAVAVVVVGLAIAFLPLLWVAVAILLLACTVRVDRGVAEPQPLAIR